MTLQKAFYMYYISGTNHAGFITNGSGDLSIFTGTSGVANRLTVSAQGFVSVFGQNAARPVIMGQTANGTLAITNPNGSITHWGYPSGGGSDNYIRGTNTIVNTQINCSESIAATNQPFCIVGGVAGASVGYGAGTIFGSLGRLFAYTSAGMSNTFLSGWDSSSGVFFVTRTGKWQVNWSFYWNNFAAGSRAVIVVQNSFSSTKETRYCALNGGGIGGDSTQAYSSLFYCDAGDRIFCNFSSGSGTLYFGGITHTHCTFYFLS